MLPSALRGPAASLLQRAIRHPVTRAAAGFTIATAIVKGVAFVKEAVVAAVFGVGSSMDSYLMAMVVIGFPSAVLLNAAQTVFIREYVRIVEVNGETAAARFVRTAVLGTLLALTAVLAAWVALLPGVLSVVGHGLTDAQRALVAGNVYRLIPYYYLNGINLLGYGVLQSRRAFLRAALIPIATPAVIMLLVAVRGADLGILIGALTVGTAIEAVLIWVLLRMSRPPLTAGAPPPRHALREFAWGTVILVPGALIAALTPVIEQTLASGLGRGAISALGYAAKLPATLNTLLTTAVGVTVLPYFSQRLSRGYDAATRAFFIRYIVALALAGTVIAALAVLLSEPFVRLAFQRGEFSPQNTQLVTALQQAYLWQLPGALVAIVAVRFVAAQGRYRALTVGNILTVPITGLMQWGLSSLFAAPGLAFGLSAGMAASAGIFIWLALRAPVSERRGAPA